MGTPNYPDDWATQWNRMRVGLQQAMTAARQRARFVSISAAEVVVGALTGRRIEINPTSVSPDGKPSPEIRFYPAEGDNFASIKASGDNSDNSVLGINGATVPSSDRKFVLQVARDQLDMMYTDLGATGPKGGMVSLTDTTCTVGYAGGPMDANYFEFEPDIGGGTDGRTVHHGRWYDRSSAAPTWGIFAGSAIETVDAIGGMIFTYGPTMATDIWPIYSLFRTNSTTWFQHKLSARSRTGFTVSWDTASTMGVHFWCFRV